MGILTNFAAGELYTEKQSYIHGESVTVLGNAENPKQSLLKIQIISPAGQLGPFTYTDDENFRESFLIYTGSLEPWDSGYQKWTDPFYESLGIYTIQISLWQREDLSDANSELIRVGNFEELTTFELVKPTPESEPELEKPCELDYRPFRMEVDTIPNGVYLISFEYGCGSGTFFWNGVKGFDFVGEEQFKVGTHETMATTEKTILEVTGDGRIQNVKVEFTDQIINPTLDEDPAQLEITSLKEEIEELKAENQSLLEQIAELTKKIDDLNQIIMEQIKVIMETLVNLTR